MREVVCACATCTADRCHRARRDPARLRAADFDCLWASSAARGLDLPEVSLVAILDADKKVLRSETSLITRARRTPRRRQGHPMPSRSPIRCGASSRSHGAARAADRVQPRHGITPRSSGAPSGEPRRAALRARYRGRRGRASGGLPGQRVLYELEERCARRPPRSNSSGRGPARSNRELARLLGSRSAAPQPARRAAVASGRDSGPERRRPMLEPACANRSPRPARDVGEGDWTTLATVPPGSKPMADRGARAAGRGRARRGRGLRRADPRSRSTAARRTATSWPAAPPARVCGPARGILTAERTASTSCSTCAASHRARRYVDESRHGCQHPRHAQDAPMLRSMAKYAVRVAAASTTAACST